MGEQSERFTLYDSADYVTGIEDVAAYLKAAIDEAGDDPALLRHSGPSPAPATSAKWRAEWA
jgi:DNA-binding phage protein